MPILHLMCGLPGSGKTTRAKELETELPALRLGSDEWMITVVGNTWDLERRMQIRAILWGIAAQALRLGADVILDELFLKSRERAEYRARALKLGFGTRVHSVDPAPEELRYRRLQRQAHLTTDTAPPCVDAEESVEFERPSADELSKTESASSRDPRATDGIV